MSLKLLTICFVISLCFAYQCKTSQDHSNQKRWNLPLLSAKELERLPPDGGDEYNRLIFEKSPYLLQHARNPVDWYPWGEQAFEKARQEDKPIFLSIGYSTCHWCHVMEHESFENQEVAKLMNQVFVSIKVDREERPDIDKIYMSACQLLTGSGGWPLTIIMNPDKKPFFTGTYFPKNGRYERVGMMELIPRIKEIWSTRRDEILHTAEQIITELQKPLDDSPGEKLDKSILKAAYTNFTQRFNVQYGGFGNAPKFPAPHNLLFLLRYWYRSGNDKALEMVERTLQAMRQGGIYDQVGFGFHRYSTDRQWLLPHFEKMLYDQALLAMAYIEAYQATGKSEYARTAREIFTYVLRDMTDPIGGFYSAEDADSEGEEGKFYVWTVKEIQKILGTEDANFLINALNLQSKGNFKDQATGELTGGNILHYQKSLAEIAADLNIPENDLSRRLESARQKLFTVREKRIHPHKDDKILTDWNGLMIAALAKGSQTLDEPTYALATKSAADFILKHLRNSDGRLLHRFRDRQAAISAYVDDYAFLIWGLLELYEATFDVHYLEIALDLNNDLLTHFWDEKECGFFFTAKDGEDLLVRQKEIHDGAIPSGNSVAAFNLLRLGRITANSDFENKAWQIVQAFSGNVRRMPTAHTQMLMALDFGFGPSYEVVIAGNSQAKDAEAMLKAMRSQFVPNKVILFVPAESETPEISRFAEFTKYQTSMNGKATAYVCLNYVCKEPTTDINEMLEMMRKKRKIISSLNHFRKYSQKNNS